MLLKKICLIAFSKTICLLWLNYFIIIWYWCLHKYIICHVLQDRSPSKNQYKSWKSFSLTILPLGLGVTWKVELFFLIVFTRKNGSRNFWGYKDVTQSGVVVITHLKLDLMDLFILRPLNHLSSISFIWYFFRKPV